MIGGGKHTVQKIDIVSPPWEHTPQAVAAGTGAEGNDIMLQGPTVVMELLPNGTVEDFVTKATYYMETELIQHLPNRLLWRFFLCCKDIQSNVVRMMIGMAFPHEQVAGEAPQLEDFPAGLSTEGPFTHIDLHIGNVMIGDFIPTEPEHEISPIMKLIDFGVISRAIRPNSVWHVAPIFLQGASQHMRDLGFVRVLVDWRNWLPR
ncbi:hypothetical protein BKA67DRAFT_537725 [Truncatella angustata]|uniref:Protein kinase domain-containing protein n=1 Tax=Truncatella angustata TaxID=152316 RepID=A0A9P8UGT5_9PEZI|nr:uncharacterized protein BKA67DRAFT_537725 [Truncatella angustata]KAH6651876.1 hypothetical protein BKA67DRAFT_537725 [Truncatella angustata]